MQFAQLGKENKNAPLNLSLYTIIDSHNHLFPFLIYTIWHVPVDLLVSFSQRIMCNRMMNIVQFQSLVICGLIFRHILLGLGSKTEEDKMQFYFLYERTKNIENISAE